MSHARWRRVLVALAVLKLAGVALWLSVALAADGDTVGIGRREPASPDRSLTAIDDGDADVEVTASKGLRGMVVTQGTHSISASGEVCPANGKRRACFIQNLCEFGVFLNAGSAATVSHITLSPGATFADTWTTLQWQAYSPSATCVVRHMEIALP